MSDSFNFNATLDAIAILEKANRAAHRDEAPHFVHMILVHAIAHLSGDLRWYLTGVHL